MNIQEFVKNISEDAFEETFISLYGNDSSEHLRQKARWINAIEHFSRLYPEYDSDIYIYSASGRTEIGGNHTDHQHGCVLAAAVNLDVLAIVGFNDSNVIRIKSEGYPKDEVCLDDLRIKSEESGTSTAIIRGIAALFTEMGMKIGGFDAYTTSDVLSGSGLSSSAAFEVLVGTIIDKHYNQGKAGAVEIAKIGQFAENVYFEKASGLMDQMVSSTGGFVAIDFNSPENPVIRNIDFDFSRIGYSLCITDTKGSHADLTEDYVSIPLEMRKVALCMGKDVLRDVDEKEFYKNLPEIRKKTSDRAVLRAMHFFDENKRAVQEADALERGDTEEFFRLVNESGESSANLLQNLYSPKNPLNQEITLAIAISKKILNGTGAVRVHGGGFAGTIQAFVPSYMAERYANELDRIFGEKSCHILNIRSSGGTEITL